MLYRTHIIRFTSVRYSSSAVYVVILILKVVAEPGGWRDPKGSFEWIKYEVRSRENLFRRTKTSTYSMGTPLLYEVHMYNGCMGWRTALLGFTG